MYQITIQSIVNFVVSFQHGLKFQNLRMTISSLESMECFTLFRLLRGTTSVSEQWYGEYLSNNKSTWFSFSGLRKFMVQEKYRFGRRNNTPKSSLDFHLRDSGIRVDELIDDPIFNLS